MKQTQLPHLLLDQSKDLFWMINLDFQLIYANKSYLNLMKEITGVEKKLNESILIEGFGKGYNEKWKAYYSRALKGEYFEIEEHFYHPASNQIQYSQVTFEPITGDDHKFFAVACQSKDITQIVKQKSAANQMMDASLDVFCTVNEQGNFVYVSAAAEKHWGYLPEELIGTCYRDLILEEDVAKTNETITSILSGNEIKSFVNRYKKKNGGIAYNLWSARWDGTTKLRYAVAKDVTEKIEQDEKILLSEQRFKAMIQEGSDLIRILDAAGNYMYVSPASTSILGIAPEEFVGRNKLEFIHRDDAEKVLAGLQKIITESKVILEPYRVQNHKKEWRWFQTKLTNMLDNPAVNGIMSNSRDITEERKLRELNRQANRLAKIGSWEVDLVNQTHYWSNEVHLLHETDPKTFIPNFELAINFYRQDFHDLVNSNVSKCIITGEPFDFEAVLVTAKKKEVWVRAIGNGEFVDGVCKRIYGSFQDINSIKNTENRLLSISDNLPGLIFQYIIYPDGTDAVKYVSKMAQQVWGFSAAEVLQNIQLVWDGVLAGGGIQAFQKSIVDSVASKTKWKARWKYVMPGGEMKTHQGYGSPNFLADGTVVFNSVIFDVTQETVNEELLEQVSKMAKVGSWELDLINLKGNNMYWSPMIKEIVGVDGTYDPTLTGGLEFCVGESKERLKHAATALIKVGLEYDIEILMLTVKGQERWIRIIGKSEIANNKRIRTYGSFQDITVRKKSEIMLAESENRFRTILEAEPECIKLLGAGGELLMMNPAGLAMIEADNEEQVIGQSMVEILLPEHRYAFSKLTKNVFKGKSGMLAFEIQGLKGNRRWLETHAVPLKNEQGDIISLLGVTRDITQRKKAEESLLQSNERFEKVTEATNEAIWDWDIVNKTIYRSKAFERFHGKESIGLFPDSDLFMRDRFHPEDFKKVQEIINEAIPNPLTTRGELEYRLLNKNGKILYVINRAVIVRNNEGKAIRMVGAITDISEQKLMTLQLSELNQTLLQSSFELKRSNEELEQFAFVASHDLQEPLRMISSFMNLLKRQYGNLLDEKGHQYIHFATDGAKRMKQIILDLLEFSRTSRPTAGIEAVDLNEVVAEFLQLRRILISEKAAIISSTDLPILNIYKAAITQILHCLLDNAIKYSKKDTQLKVEISAEENETHWQFSIKDNGIGIEPQFHNKIFVIFQRLHNKDEYDGTGIGLSIAKRHVEFLGGRIWLESVPGKGTVFYFTIPTNK